MTTTKSPLSTTDQCRTFFERRYFMSLIARVFGICFIALGVFSCETPYATDVVSTVESGTEACGLNIIAKGSGAFARPCLTTEEFMRAELNLSAEQIEKVNSYSQYLEERGRRSAQEPAH
jgi:hypothetical protein